MADTMQVDLVSPERMVASVQASEVRIPGADGDLTAMPDHSPLITTLRPGVLVIVTGGKEEKYLVTGGFAEIGKEGTSILAERAHHADEVSQEMIDQMVEEAHQEYGRAKETWQNEPGPVDDAAKLLSDMVAAGEHIGLSPKQPSL
ncbi:F0F1 ATP synthase subunit epsilon [Roseicyclus sp. F158]|uniref:ATP synthase epsilon chain n=1 Tax=Tropicimonas omnivorans TaxID=3075590 RepID=A0ABU3DFV9_9RHOB|nr:MULTISPECIES: F0F1 ATP synthase subunit epsilon [Roseobacteraceae]MDT0682575.1 F0F1 ATP synthase subunit epsilon [Roseicyclus sp. F158]